MGPIWGRQDPDGPHVGPMNFAIWDTILIEQGFNFNFNFNFKNSLFDIIEDNTVV